MPASLRLEIFVADIQKSVDFYTKTLQFRLIIHDGEYVYVGRDNIYLGIISVPALDPLSERTAYRQPAKGLEIVLEVDELEAERDRIVKDGFSLHDDTKAQSWGLRDFRLFDPDGYYLRFTTHSPKKDGKGFSD